MKGLGYRLLFETIFCIFTTILAFKFILILLSFRYVDHFLYIQHFLYPLACSVLSSYITIYWVKNYIKRDFMIMKNLVIYKKGFMTTPFTFLVICSFSEEQQTNSSNQYLKELINMDDEELEELFNVGFFNLMYHTEERINKPEDVFTIARKKVLIRTLEFAIDEKYKHVIFNNFEYILSEFENKKLFEIIEEICKKENIEMEELFNSEMNKFLK